MSQPHRRSAADEVLRLFSKAAKQAKEFGMEAIGTFVPPLGRYMREQVVATALQNSLHRQGFVAKNVPASETQYLSTGKGPLKRTVVAQPQADQWDRRLPSSGLDGTIDYLDVKEKELAIINTYDGVVGCLEQEARTWIVNSDLGAEKGSLSAVLPSPKDQPDPYVLIHPEAYVDMSKLNINIGLRISRFEFQDPAAMWEVIDPLIQNVKLLGPRLGDIFAAGAGSLGHRLLGEAPKVVEGVKSTVENIGIVKERAEKASELIRGEKSKGRVDIGEKVFIVQFFAIGFGGGPSGHHAVSTHSKCTHLLRVTADKMAAGKLLQDMRATIMTALDEVRSQP